MQDKDFWGSVFILHSIVTAVKFSDLNKVSTEVAWKLQSASPKGANKQDNISKSPEYMSLHYILEMCFDGLRQ